MNPLSGFNRYRSAGEAFWLNRYGSGDFPDVSKHPQLVEARERLGLTTVHELVIQDLSEDLALHVKNFPAALLIQDDYGFTLIHWAALCGAIKSLEVLINAGADLNARCKHGRTPMAWASYIASAAFDVCEILIRAGADVNITDMDGTNALMHTVGSAPSEHRLVALLLDAGAEIHHKCEAGSTALYCATSNKCVGSVESCSLLIAHGALLPEGNPYGQDFNLLVPAIRNHNHPVLELLIESGIKLNAVASEGDLTSIDMAAMCADNRTMAILRDARIQGLPMDEQTVIRYWYCFNCLRGDQFFGTREPIDEERAAFQELLDSVTPLEPRLIKSQTVQEMRMPGAFPGAADDLCDYPHTAEVEAELIDDDVIDVLGLGVEHSA